jgi:hypothetical protein
MNCRFCKSKLSHLLADLQNSPASNSYLNLSQTEEPEIYYPLKVMVCDNCFLAQIEEVKKKETIFNDSYAYFSSYSSSWLLHCEDYVNKVIKRFKLNSDSSVIEIASNDGYLLQYFLSKNIPSLGIEPTSNTAKIAKEKGIETLVNFFSTLLAEDLVTKRKKPTLIIGNNVLAHVPKLNDFVNGLKVLLANNGVITMEFPHIIKLIDGNQFDTIYHEHFSYFSFTTVNKIFEYYGLEIFDVEEIKTHGGSLRIYSQHLNHKPYKTSSAVNKLLEYELKKGIKNLKYYKNFQFKIFNTKIDLLSFIIAQNKLGKSIAGYGAAAKGNTLMNFCGIKKDLIKYVVDKNPEKSGKYMPASHIPIKNEEYLKISKPDYVIIFPWNLRDEITEQLSYIRDWNGKFVIPIPKLEIF